MFSVLDESSGTAFRGTFIVDRNLTIRVAHINDNPLGRNVDEMLRLVQAVQYSDKYGEVCPANWAPGKATIIPDIIKFKEFFSKAV